MQSTKKAATELSGNTASTQLDLFAERASAGHGRIVCSLCGGVIVQCRCMDNHGVLAQGICESCKKELHEKRSSV